MKIFFLGYLSVKNLILEIFKENLQLFIICWWTIPIPVFYDQYCAATDLRSNLANINLLAIDSQNATFHIFSLFEYWRWIHLGSHLNGTIFFHAGFAIASNLSLVNRTAPGPSSMVISYSAVSSYTPIHLCSIYVTLPVPGSSKTIIHPISSSNQTEIIGAVGWIDARISLC